MPAARGGRRTVAVVATLDTKHEEVAFLASQLGALGFGSLIVDIGLAGTPRHRADITREAVAEAAGIPATSKQELLERAARGAAILVAAEVDAGQVDGVIAIGGGQGTWMAMRVLGDLPFGVPKAIVTTSPRTAFAGLGSADITVIPSVADVGGMNRVLAQSLRTAVAAVAGRLALGPLPPSDLQAIALTMYGVTTPGAQAAAQAISAAGYEPIVFSANAVGGPALERLAAAGHFAAVLDFTTTEIANEVVGDVPESTVDRLTAASSHGLPQVVVPGALDVVTLGDPRNVGERFDGRTIVAHRPGYLLMRADAEEMRRSARLIAARLHASAGPAAVAIPARGFSALDVPGGAFYDPDADRAFIDELSARIDPSIPIEIVDAHINDVEFGQAAAALLLRLLQTTPREMETTP